MRNTLILKISYYKYLVDSLPSGWIGMHNNNPAVFIIKDKNNPNISRTNKKRHYLTTTKGQYYKSLLDKKIKAQNILDSLLEEWKNNYAGIPPIMDWPIKQNNRILTPSFFENAKPNQNNINNKNPILYKGQYLRSKNELLAIQQIEKYGFEWKTEVCIKIGDLYFYPDVLFYVPYLDRVIALEIDGMVEREYYLIKSNKRSDNYYKAGFVNNLDVCFFKIHDATSFDMVLFKQTLDFAIECNATDILYNQTAPQLAL